jgi:hypothetical protein
MMALEGKGPLYLPTYSDRVPVEYTARCYCGVRYLIFNPGMAALHSLGDAEGRAKERAAQFHCTFINSQLSPFMLCPCGECLDFTPGDVAELVM